METTVAEATTTSMKAEREYTALKESLSSMNSHWQREVQSLKAEVKKKEDQWAKEREDMTLKYKSVLKLQQSVRYVPADGKALSLLVKFLFTNDT